RIRSIQTMPRVNGWGSDPPAATDAQTFRARRPGFFWIDPNDTDAHRPSVLWRGRQVMKLMPHTSGRTSLSAAIAFAVAAMAALPAPSFAQDAAPSEADAQETTPATADAATLDAVRVTGYRYAIEQSLDQKRNANAIVEVVTAEDVGKFPDKNVADAL